jgi:SpoVK/Ycf46/Vps4 family AAA+-type ATPase
MEVNYLLQRVEEYSGVVILASNLRQNIDEAFLRRIQVMVEFPAPNAEARLRILAGLFPPGVEAPAEAEMRELADRLKLAGGSLKNIVLDAAFRAFSEGQGSTTRVEIRHLVAAAGREYQKLGRPITRGEFGSDFYSYVQEYVL